MLFKHRHSLALSYYESEKIDLLYQELIDSVSDYISPSSNSNNYNLSLKSYINDYWDTDIYLSSSYFDFSKKETVYYQEQDISTLRVGFSFKNKNIINKISTWIDYSDGEGTSDYTQYGIKLLADLKLYKNLFMNLSLRHYYKKISYVDLDKSNKTKNSIIRASLSYRF